MRMATDRAYPAVIYRPAYGAVLDSVRRAIHRCRDRYTAKDVQNALVLMEEHLTQVSVGDAMQRLLRKKEIRVAKRGKGGRLTIYKK